MKNYLTLKNPNSVIVGIIVISFIGYMAGIRFENIYVNKIIGLLFLVFPIYLFVLILRAHFEKKILKIILAIIFGLITIGSLPFIFFAALDVYPTIQDSGNDPAFKKVNVLDMNTSRVVVYRSNGGATTDFAVIVRSEKWVLPGLYVKRDLINIYHVDDITLSIVSPNSIKIDAINFTTLQYRAEYMSRNPQVTEGEVINI